MSLLPDGGCSVRRPFRNIQERVREPHRGTITAKERCKVFEVETSHRTFIIFFFFDDKFPTTLLLLLLLLFFLSTRTSMAACARALNNRRCKVLKPSSVHRKSRKASQGAKRRNLRLPQHLHCDVIPVRSELCCDCLISSVV